MVQKLPNAGKLAVGSGTFFGLADGEEKQGEEAEDVGEYRVHAILPWCLLLSYFIQFRHFLYKLML